jgi:uncharacterized protein YjiS (DUF1127 family)
MAYVNQTRTAAASPMDRIMALVETVKASRARRRVFNRTVRELNSLNDRELADLGIHRLSITEIARQAAFGK